MVLFFSIKFTSGSRDQLRLRDRPTWRWMATPRPSALRQASPGALLDRHIKQGIFNGLVEGIHSFGNQGQFPVFSLKYRAFCCRFSLIYLVVGGLGSPFRIFKTPETMVGKLKGSFIPLFGILNAEKIWRFWKLKGFFIGQFGLLYNQ